MKRKLPLLFILFILILSRPHYNYSFQSSTEDNILKIEKNPLIEENKSALHSVETFQSTFRQIASSVIPAVVHIRTTSKSRRMPRDNILSLFFPNIPVSASGSGFFLTSDGYIATNYHVIKDADTIEVYLNDGKSYNATLVGVDEKTDCALIQIQGNNYTKVYLGDSRTVKVGDIAIAIGNPFGLRGSITFGIISAVGRKDIIDQDAIYKNFLQTDAAINQGNSGGPLLNIYGQVIGMNTAIFSNSGGGSIGIGFAIPMDIVKDVLSEIILRGSVQRGIAGIAVRDLNAREKASFGLTDGSGIIITSIQIGGAAFIAKLKPGDIIYKFDDNKINSTMQLREIFTKYRKGDSIQVFILRNGRRLKTVLTFGGDEDPLRFTGNIWNWAGVVFGNTNEYSEYFNIESSSKGALALHVDPNSPTSNFLSAGSLIYQLNRTAINSVDDLKSELSKYRSGNIITIFFTKGSRRYLIRIRLS